MEVEPEPLELLDHRLLKRPVAQMGDKASRTTLQCNTPDRGQQRRPDPCQALKIEVGDRMGDLDLCVFQIEVQGVAGSSPREDVDQGADLSAWWFLIHLIGSWMFTAGPPLPFCLRSIRARPTIASSPTGESSMRFIQTRFPTWSTRTSASSRRSTTAWKRAAGMHARAGCSLIANRQPRARYTDAISPSSG